MDRGQVCIHSQQCYQHLYQQQPAHAHAAGGGGGAKKGAHARLTARELEDKKKMTDMIRRQPKFKPHMVVDRSRTIDLDLGPCGRGRVYRVQDPQEQVNFYFKKD